MMAMPALAQFGTGPGAQQLPSSPITTVTGVTGLFCTIMNWMFTILILVAIFYVLLAAFKFVTSNGDSEKTKKARDMIIYAAVAIAAAILAKGIPLIVGNFFGVGGFQGC